MNFLGLNAIIFGVTGIIFLICVAVSERRDAKQRKKNPPPGYYP